MKFYKVEAIPLSPTPADDGIYYVKSNGPNPFTVKIIHNGAVYSQDSGGGNNGVRMVMEYSATSNGSSTSINLYASTYVACVWLNGVLLPRSDFAMFGTAITITPAAGIRTGDNIQILQTCGVCDAV